MEWIIITDETVAPDTEVLAIGYQDEILVGWLSQHNGDWECESDGETLGDVVAFIPTKNIVGDYYNIIDNGKKGEV